MDKNGEKKPNVIRYIGGDSTQYAAFSDEQLNEIIDHIINYLFPDPAKATGSFFNDTLTMILTLDLFMDAVVRVLLIIGASVVAWGVGAWLLDRRVKALENKEQS